MKPFPTQQLATACALALLTSGAVAQRRTPNADMTAQIQDTNNRVIQMDWLHNNAAVYTGDHAGSALGKGVSAAGDVNGDGLADMLVASFGTADNAAPGTVQIVFGVDHGLPSSTNLTTPTPVFTGNGTGRANGSSAKPPMTKPADTHVTLVGDGLGSRTGAAMASAGDVNGDGLDDVLIGAPRADAAGIDSGTVYVVFGRTDWPETLGLNKMASNDGLILHGPNADDRLGSAVAGAGDVNGDGFDDMLLGASWSSTFDGPAGTGLFGSSAGLQPTHGGAAYLVYGTDRFTLGFDLDRLNGSRGLILAGGHVGDNAGAALAAAGDVNGDGLADMLIGVPHADPNGVWNAGEAFLLLGSTSLPDMLDLGAFPRTMGLTIQGAQANERLGSAVAGGSDMDADGLPDFAIGAPGYDDSPFNGSDEGRVVLIFGGNNVAGLLDLGASEGTVTAGGSVNFSGNGGRNTSSTVAYAQPRQPQVKYLTGAMPGDLSGSTLVMGGNLQHDRFGDLVIGATGSKSTWLVNGSKNLPDSLDLAVVSFRGMEFQGDVPANTPVAFLGDMDGDHFDDLAMGAADASPGNLAGAGTVSVIKGNANFALAAGAIESGKTFNIHLHGTPGVSTILLVSASALKVPISTWRGDYWLGDKHFETVIRTFDADGEIIVPVAVPAVGFAGATLFWQSVTLPQGNGADMTGLLRTQVAP